jgi:phospholipid/cholesterol/gamma-HCH transport system substrate-binding protein
MRIGPTASASFCKEAPDVSRPLSRLGAVLLALVVLAGLVLGVVLLFSVGAGGWFGPPSFEIRASFQDVSGIEPGARVRINGVVAGEVISVQRGPDEASPVILRLRIKGDYRNDMRQGAYACIVPEGLLGNKAIAIRYPEDQKLDDLPLLASGDLVPSEPGADPIQGAARALQGMFGGGPVTGLSSRNVVLRAGFDDITGVSAGTQVFIRGMAAGKVTSVEFRPDDDPPIVLHLRINEAFRRYLREGATVRIVSGNLLGIRHVDVRPPVPPRGKKLQDLPSVSPGTLLPSGPPSDMMAAVSELGPVLKKLGEGKGTLGKLVSDPEAYDALVAFLRTSNDTASRGKDTLASIKRGSEAIKKVPLIGGYVEEGPTTLLVRANSERNDRIFAESELFEPNRAVLTAKGKAALDEIGEWLTGLRHAGSEVVVVSYADPRRGEGETRTEITRQQAQVVVDYIKSKHAAHKLGGWGWFSGNRKVTALGMGTARPPLPDKRALPASRVEVIVFVPQE